MSMEQEEVLMDMNFSDGVLISCNTREAVVCVPEGIHTIGESAFKGCVSIERLELPDTVTAICAHAFKGCRNLREIKMSQQLAYLGDYAFHRCHKLRSIVLPASVKSLGNCAFLYCDSLETVWMPGVEKLGQQVFVNDVKLKNLLISTELDQNCICDCFTSCTDIREIGFSDGTVYQIENAVVAMAPDSDVPPLVKAIAKDICRMMEVENGTVTRFLTNLKYVDIVEGITAIGKSCFLDRKGIITVRLPESLVKIDSRAFRNCIKLERLEFHSTDVEIHEDAFKNCSSLRYVKMADGQEYELKGLTCLSEATVPYLVKEIHRQVLGNFQISGTTLLRYWGAENRVVVPDGITAIGERAFAGNEAIDKVILPDSVQRIGEEAFADCLILQTITLPDGLQVLEQGAFLNCVKLIRAILPNSLKKVSESAFKRCRVLHEVSLGAQVECIEAMAFYGCQKLKEIHLPKSLKKLGDMAFYQCFSLQEIVLPASIRDLGNHVFTLSGVKRAVVGCTPDRYGMDVFSQCKQLKALIFEEPVHHIGDKFAFHCENLISVTLPSALKTVGRNTFEGSIYLQELSDPKMAGTILLDGSGMQGDITLPETVTAIAGGAFYGNPFITSVTLPKSVVYVGPRAFCGCSGLKKVLLSSGLTVLEEGCFAYCTALETVDFNGHEGRLNIVKDKAFAGCGKLVQVPSLQYLSQLGAEAFADCVQLKDLGRMAESDLAIGDGALRGTLYLKEQERKNALVVLSGTVIHGGNCTGKLVIPEGITRIGDFAFFGNDSITSISFPASLKEIGKSAFACCRSLQAVLFHGSSCHLNESAFETCTALIEITIPTVEIAVRSFACCKKLTRVVARNTKKIGKEAFYGCEILKTWQGTLVDEIGEMAFSGCEALENFALAAVKHIGKRAFERCDSLQSIMIAGDVAIGAHAFEDCGRLEHITLCVEKNEIAVCAKKHPNLESYAFSGCTNVHVVTVGNACWEISNYRDLFDGQLPQAVRDIYGSALSCFYVNEAGVITEYYNNSRYVMVPAGIVGIGGEVFRDKYRLTEISIPDSIKNIGSRVFDRTAWLELQRKQCGQMPVMVNHIIIDGAGCCGDVVIPDHITSIAGWAFAGNLELTGVIFLSSRTSVDDHAFRNCLNIKRIVLADGTEYRLTGLRQRTQEVPLFVERIIADCYKCFKTDDAGILCECTGNISRMNLPGGVTAIGQSAFKDSNLLTAIHFTDEITAIDHSAFEQCKWLTQVMGVSHVERIGIKAFSGCIRLQEISSLESLNYLGERAFENCTELKEIILPEGIEEIPKRAFYRCHNLQRITVPSTLRYIGEEAFAFCYKLPNIELPDRIEKVGERAFAWCPNYGERL